MSEDAPVNTGAAVWPELRLGVAWRYGGCRPNCTAGRPGIRGRRFDDLYNLVCDPAFLMVAWERVAGNAGARTAGIDRATVAWIVVPVSGWRRSCTRSVTSCGPGRSHRSRYGR